METIIIHVSRFLSFSLFLLRSDLTCTIIDSTVAPIIDRYHLSAEQLSYGIKFQTLSGWKYYGSSGEMEDSTQKEIIPLFFNTI